jgi:hypothetical protein
MSPSLIVSIFAVIISGIAVYISWRTQKRLVDIEDAREQDRLAEKNKANLIAKITKEELRRSSTSRIHWKYHLVVENKGLSEARNVQLLLADKTILEHPAVQNPREEVKHVGPQSSFKYEFSSGFMRDLPLKTKITWEDDSGELGEYSTMLTL